MKEKYIELLLKRCLKIKSKILFINYDIINQSFVDDIVKFAKNMKIDEIYLDKCDAYEEHDILKNISLEDIENHEYFNSSIWDEYAKKDASFLILETEFPGLMDDIDPNKIAKATLIKRSTKPLYKKLQLSDKLSWCIAAYPNELWAKNIFKDKENSYKLLENAIYKMCMIDTNNPIESWNNYLKNNKVRVGYLNSLNIKELHYKNSLGTDLKIELNKDGIWCDASSDGIENMPSYEIFTSPNYLKTSGIVYSSKPLIYNGALIDDFWIKFENGKAIDCKAEVGEEILKGIINGDSNSCYLGECALVPYNSPISNTKLVFGTTLIDENASCHLALGAGFTECLKCSKDISEQELLSRGVNVSKTHVDFMIGTPDLEIEAITFNNEKVKIFEKGNFKTK